LRKIVLILFVLSFLFGKMSAQDINVWAGINYGGPLPTEVIDSSSGTPKVGISAGVSYDFPINDQFYFSPGIFYSYHGLKYSQTLRRDTLFTIEINGVSGQVPSFYTAYVDGVMGLHYINLPLLMGFKVWKFNFLLGPYISFIIAGKDNGNVKAVVGEGGFFEDYYESFDNFSKIRKFDQGIIFGGDLPLFKSISIRTKVSRSFLTLYKPSNAIDGPGSVKMYNTYMHLGLVYKI
jgi:hypothetical protein